MLRSSRRFVAQSVIPHTSVELSRRHKMNNRIALNNQTYILIYKSVSIYIFMNIYKYILIYIYIYTCIYTNIYVYTKCVYIYIYIYLSKCSTIPFNDSIQLDDSTRQCYGHRHASLRGAWSHMIRST